MFLCLSIYLFNYIFNLYATSDSQTLLPCLLIARFPGLHATSGHGRPNQVMRNALLRVFGNRTLRLDTESNGVGISDNDYLIIP